MKRQFAVIAFFLAAAFVAVAEGVFAEYLKSEYKVTESTSLGASVNISASGTVVRNVSGDVSGTVVFNTKTKIIKFSDRKVKYKDSDLVSKIVNRACITSGKGTLVNDGREVSFQIIEDYRNGNINMIVTWPDYSSVRFLADLQSRTELK